MTDADDVTEEVYGLIEDALVDYEPPSDVEVRTSARGFGTKGFVATTVYKEE